MENFFIPFQYFHYFCGNLDFIINLINDGDLILLKIPGAENPADMLTKTVTTTKLRLCIDSTSLQEN